MLNDMIIDSARELAEDNALDVDLYNVDIIHRISQMVDNHLTSTDETAKLAVAAYRYYEKRMRETRLKVAQLESALVS